jgi:hypothetical protein
MRRCQVEAPYVRDRHAEKMIDINNAVHEPWIYDSLGGFETAARSMRSNLLGHGDNDDPDTT